MSTVREHNNGLQMEPVEHPYDYVHIYNHLNRAIQNEGPGDRNQVQALRTALVMVPPKVLYIMAAIVVLSFFATIVTMIFTLTMLSGSGGSTCTSSDRAADRGKR